MAANLQIGARIVWSIAMPKRSQALRPSVLCSAYHLAADKNVRAPILACCALPVWGGHYSIDPKREKRFPLGGRYL
jgi:hypothetical protein